jgi:predicted transcriptional regulator
MIALTRAEEQVMLKLWELKKASVKELLLLFESPKPAYNTTSTIIRILEKKKIVGHKIKGRGYIYFPKISKEEYGQMLTEHLIKCYYDGNRSQLISELNKSKSLSEIL